MTISNLPAARCPGGTGATGRPDEVPPPPAGGLDVLDDVCGEVFASLPRRDQRRRGLEYVHGLLVTPGRKSIRNIAAICDGPAADQRLNHLVSGSTWAWSPVRRALRGHLESVAPVRALVARPMTTPRSGRNAVGVTWADHEGETSLAQRAIGLWAASASAVTPVEWRLRLPASWLDDPRRRRDAGVPDDAREESDTDAVAALCTDTLRHHPAGAPLVVDADHVDLAALLRALRPSGMPVLARVDEETPVVLDDHPAGRHRDEITAGRVATGAVARRPLPGGAQDREAWVATARVRLPGPTRSAARPSGRGGTRAGDLDLVAVGRRGRTRPEQIWLTTATDTAPAVLLGLGAALSAVEDHEADGSTSRAGVGHYCGRSFPAWHRHTTLASVAHAVRELAATDPAGERARPSRRSSARPSSVAPDTVRRAIG